MRREGKQKEGRNLGNVQTRRSSGALLVGMSLMGIVYGWIVSAGEIETDLNAVATAISTASKGQITIDGAGGGLPLLEQVSNAVETQQNNTINTELYASSTMAPADAMITKHFGSYCMQGSESGNCPSDPLLQLGDIKVSSILSGTTYDAARAQAAQDFLTNLLDPPSGPNVFNFQSNVPINANTVTADPTLKANYVQALSDEALLSIARQPFAEMIAKRTPPSNGGVSEMRMMEQQAIQRLMSGNWPQNLAQMQPQQIAQDQALMQAYQVWLEYQRYRQMERIEALLAVLVLQNFRAQKTAASFQVPTSQDINNAAQQSSGVSGSGVSP